MEPTLSNVRNLLDSANRRVQEEASKYRHDVPVDLRRTMTDISTIQSVIRCPIFQQIVNVTDSLDKLSHHVNLHPSIGPLDVNIDSNGELILSPPLEPTSLNNLINSRQDEFLNHTSQLSNALDVSKHPELNNGSLEHSNNNSNNSSSSNSNTTTTTSNNNNNNNNNNMGYITSAESNNQPRYQTEKLIANGTEPPHLDGTRRRRAPSSKIQSVAAVFENVGYSNEMYSRVEGMEEKLVQPNARVIEKSHHDNVTAKRVSPSTSAGSTVPLADECDSGTSSFRSQNAKGALCSPQSHKPIPQLDEDPQSADEALVEGLSPGVAQIKVTLEKDNDGLGITVAGYVCEDEDISGIFIKNITPGGPADRSGKIHLDDQICAVNERKILGYNNTDAVHLLRTHNDKVVTLELMRYLDEEKRERLHKLLTAVPARKTADDSRQAPGAQAASALQGLIKAQPGLGAASPRRMPQQATESIYNNDSAFFPSNDSPASTETPVAAQRGASASKVIETKQGARNTVDIRSPMCAVPNDRAVAEARPTKQDEFSQLVRDDKLEWERDVKIVDLYRDPSQSLGFSVKDYVNPKDEQQSIFMIVAIAEGGIAERDGRLSVGDLLMFVDDTNLDGASPREAMHALRRTSGQVRLGVLKFKRNF